MNVGHSPFDQGKVVFLILPWLVAPSYGPSPAIVPMLVTWAALGFYVLFEGAKVKRGWDIPVAWLLSAAISGTFAVCQYFSLADALPWISPAKAGEAYGNLRQRNQFATLCNIGLAVLLFRAGLEQDAGRKMTWWAAVAALFLMATNAASGSRTGLVQLFTLFVLLALWHGLIGALRDPVLRAATLGYVLAALGFALLGALQHTGGGIWSRVQDAAPACASRTVLWSNVLHLIAQKPWFGWGWGELDYAHFITLYPGERFCEILDNAHNLPLHLAVELGIPAAAVFFGGCAWLVLRNRPWAEKDPTRQMAWSVLAVIGLHSMLEYPLWYGPFQLAVVLSLWLLWRNPEEHVASVQASLSVRVVTGAAVAALLVLCAFVAWDYWRISQIYLPPAARHAAYREDTMAKIQGSWFFKEQVQFAELSTTTLAPDNAAHIHELARRMLHFSPDPRVVEKVIESAVMLQQDEDALFYLQRYKAAFPAQHARWSAALKVPQ